MDYQEEMCRSILADGIDGGISYWAVFKDIMIETVDEDGNAYTSIQLKPESFYEGEAFETGDPRNDWQIVDIPKLKVTVGLLVSPAGKDICPEWLRIQLMEGWSGPDMYHGDADTADAVLQLAMFGEIVFS